MMEEERKCCSSKEHREGENNEELQQFDSDRKGGRGEEGGNGEGGRILAFLPSVRVHSWLRHVVHIRAHVLYYVCFWRIQAEDTPQNPDSLH